MMAQTVIIRRLDGAVLMRLYNRIDVGPHHRVKDEAPMALLLGKLYRALRSAEVSDDQAQAAAEEVAQFENRVAKVEGDLLSLRWMVATNIALTAGLYALPLRGV